MRIRAKGGAAGRLGRLAALAAACVLVFDSAGMVINRVLLDEAARVAAAHAASEVRDANRVPAPQLAGLAAQAAEESLADQPGIELLELVIDDGVVRLRVRRRANVLLADRISSLDGKVDAEVTAAAPIQPPAPQEG